LNLRNDTPTRGLLIGVIVPPIVFVIIFYLKFSSNYDFAEFTRTFLREKMLITFFAAWCLLSNIAVFTFFINTDKYQTGKGIFFSTLFYGILFLVLRMLN